MSLFQKSVEKKYLNELDPVLIDRKYKEFQDYFGNTLIQENIRNSKEEQFQEGFLRELFVSVFEYTLNPQPNFNLTTELKNIANSKKADGAILKGEDAIAVIELKGTDTSDLDKIEIQAFGYKNHNPKCVYVITSNFEKLRFYIQNAVDHIDFDLFKLTREQFSLMWLCLAKDNLMNGLPQKIKESSLLQEENITKKLYADYSKFREAIYNNLVKSNPETDKLLLFKKTQKLLDRFLFILFAEDRLLLPPNSISEIVKQWKTLKDELDEYVPLYDRFKKYFGYMNTGYQGKNYEIYAYNGGLFAPDEILDNISIDDEIIYNHTAALSQYNYETDVDVNILGHIFEHSLGEIENVQAEIKGEKIESQKTKRKKDGIFYTPKYITKYIVENTVGKLCEEKRAELGIIDEEYAKGRKNRKNDIVKILDDKLTDYRNWLLSLTILDPACGSGAFLNQALDFLISEHRKIDDLRAQLFGSGLVFSDITTDILEKNIYGVDLNEESVEIAKLSLWLRTAQKGRKLNKLNNNIKCGNSLIDDPAVAGEKAFNWEREFPQVFGQREMEAPYTEVPKDKKPDYLKLIKEKSLEAQLKAEQALSLSKEAAELSKKVYEYAEKLNTVSDINSLYGINKGGFDVVIGNPPYVHLEKMKDVSESLSKMSYKTFDKRGDLYCLFVEKGFNVLKPNGIISYIMPNKWLQAGYGKPLREYFLSFELNQLIDFGDIQIFEGATTYPCIFLSRKAKPKTEFTVSVLKEANKGDFYTNVIQTAETFKVDQFSGETWVVSSGNDKKLIEKLQCNFRSLSEFVGGEAFYGMKTGLTEAFLIDEPTKKKLIYEDPKAFEIIKPVLRGRDIDKWVAASHDCYLIGTFPALNLEIEKYPSIQNYLLGFGKERLEQSGAKGSRKKSNNKWFETQDTFAYWDKFSKPKIMYQKFQVKPCFIFDESGLYCNDSMWIIPTNDKGLLAILNSKMGWWLITKYCTQIQNGCQLIWKYFGQIPIPTTNEDLAMKADQMLSLNKHLQETAQKFQRNLQREFNLEKLSGKLENWFQTPFTEFIKELEKSKVKLTLSQKSEWEDYFIQEQKKALDIKHQIDNTDKEIDQMVYALYGLTEEEIKIVEEAV